MNNVTDRIIEVLELPENRDLLMAVILFSNNENDRSSESFMHGFSLGHNEPQDFDTFAQHIHQIESQLKGTILETDDIVDVSKLYDEYLEERKEARDKSGLTPSQAKRFDTIMNAFDDGWSGAAFGLICRQVQRDLRMKYANNN